MEFRILGPLEVVDGDRALPLGPPRQQGVLAVLLVSANRVVTFDRLVDELWAGAPPPAARGSLQAYVSNLRRVLEPRRPPGAPPAVLVTRAQGYVLQVDPGRLDATRFEVAAAEGGRLLAGGRPGAARARLTDALGWWRGPALADFADQPFARVEAARLDELRQVAVEDRLEAELALGHHRAVVAELEGEVAAQPLRERRWELLLLALYRSGRQAEALRAFQRARHHLADELGIEPGPELRRLEAEILAQSPALDWRPPPGEGAGPVPAPPPGGTAGPPPAPEPGPGGPPEPGEEPLVGRRSELARLEEALGRAAAGRGGVLLVGGEPGIGKTRLARELLAAARARGFLTGWGAAVEGGGAPAFRPWATALREVADQAGPGAAEALDDAVELRRLLGGGGPGGPSGPAAAEPGAGRFRLLEAVAGFLRRLGGPRGVVLVLDDLQWADAGSLELLGHLGASVGRQFLLVAATYRPQDVPSDHPLVDTLARLSRHQVVERLDLGGLSGPEVAELLAGVAGPAAGGELAEAVRDRTGGNPFFVGELARHYREVPDADPADLAVLVPAGVRDLVRGRLARLSPPAADLLAHAAVAGVDFDARVVGPAADVGLERSLELLDEAVAAGLVGPGGGPAGRYRFRHDLVRATVLGELASGRRARLHARVGDALATRWGDDDRWAVELAHHRYLGVSAGDPAVAADAALRAAEVALAGWSPEQAAEQLARARELVGLLPPGPGRDHRELDALLRSVSLLMATEGYAAPGAGPLLARAERLCRERGERHQLVAVLWRLTAFLVVAGRFGEAARLAAQLLDVARVDGDAPALAAAHQAMGVTALHRGDLVAARAHLEAALADVAALDDPWLSSWMPLHPRVACASFLAVVLALAGEAESAELLGRDTTAVARRLDHDFAVVHALVSEAWVACVTGDGARAAGASDDRPSPAAEAGALARARGFALYSAMAGVLEAWRTAAGDPAPAAIRLDEGIAAMEATGARMLQTFFLGLLADAHRREGRPRRALEAVDRALARAEGEGERLWEAELLRHRGELLAELWPDRREEGAATVARAAAVARGQGAVALARRAEESLRGTGVRRP